MRRGRRRPRPLDERHVGGGAHGDGRARGAHRLPHAAAVVAARGARARPAVDVVALGRRVRAKALAGLDDVEGAFAVDARACTSPASRRAATARTRRSTADGAAARFGAIVIGGNGASLLRAAAARVVDVDDRALRHATGVQPGVVESRLAQYTAAWNLTTHELVESGAMFEHRWSTPTGRRRRDRVRCTTTRRAATGHAHTADHCAPSGTDAPPNAPWAYFGRFPLRLSCPQPDPTVAEQGVAGQTWSAFFDRHLARGV